MEGIQAIVQEYMYSFLEKKLELTTHQFETERSGY